MDIEKEIQEFLQSLEKNPCPPPGPDEPYRVGHAGRSKGYSWSFYKFDSRDFEIMCFNIVRAKHQHVGAQLLSRGTKQNGMDIYSYGRDDISGKLHAYECKRYGDHGVIGKEPLTFADVRQAVERFESEGRPDLCCSFTLIAATDVQNGFDSERNELRNRLKQQYGINLEIWGREHVWAELAVLPVVAGRFIDEPEFSILTESYYNHARRLAAIQHEMELRDPQKQEARIAQWARAREAGPPTIHDESNSYVWKDGLVHLTALLLGMDDRVGGCAVSILAPGHDSAIITLTPTQILELFWPHHGRTDGIENRRFVSLLYPFSKDQVSLDFPNVKVFVPESVACSLTKAVDAFVPRHLKALNDLERAWGAERFQFIYNRQGEAKVLLGSVPELVWEKMVAFSCAHDNSRSPPERFSFDSDYSGSMLKIYTSEAGPTLDAGYHAIIHGRQTGGRGAPVELCWQPSLRRHAQGLGPRAIWDALTTFNWLKDELLPTVLRPPAQSFRKLFKRRTVAAPTGDDLSDYRSPDLRSLLNSVGPADLTRLVRELQHIFSMAASDGPMTLAATDYVSILGGIRDVAKRIRPSYLGYAASALGLPIPNDPDLDQFVRAIDQSITSEQSHSYSCAEVEYALRALMDILRSPEPLSPDLARKLRHNLEPLIAKAEEIQLVWRHRRQEDRTFS